MASDRENMRQSARNKLEEFKRLGYPIPMLKQMCNYIATTTGNGTWINIRNNIT